MTAEPAPTISIALTSSQVRQVVRAATREHAPGLHLLLGATGPLLLGATGPGGAGGPRLSRSLLRGLALLARFGPDRAERGVVELAAELRMSPSTAHRYVLTLVEAGLLEQVPGSRKYRLAGGRAT